MFNKSLLISVNFKKERLDNNKMIFEAVKSLEKNTFLIIKYQFKHMHIIFL